MKKSLTPRITSLVHVCRLSAFACVFFSTSKTILRCKRKKGQFFVVVFLFWWKFRTSFCSSCQCFETLHLQTLSILRFSKDLFGDTFSQWCITLNIYSFQMRYLKRFHSLSIILCGPIKNSRYNRHIHCENDWIEFD